MIIYDNEKACARVILKELVSDTRNHGYLAEGTYLLHGDVLTVLGRMFGFSDEVCSVFNWS